eukprot:jgi/Bigna1/43930/e_gw1.86.73.1
MRPIGKFRSCFKEKYGTPRQGAVAKNTRGHVQFYSWVPPDSLDGLEAFSHAWLVFWFHRNTNKVGGWVVSGKVKAPRLQGESVGIFASRSPHRINPIGQSLAGGSRNPSFGTWHVDTEPTLRIDLIEGTPILDLKPLHPGSWKIILVS